MQRTSVTASSLVSVLGLFFFSNMTIFGFGSHGIYSGAPLTQEEIVLVREKLKEFKEEQKRLHAEKEDELPLSEEEWDRIFKQKIAQGAAVGAMVGSSAWYLERAGARYSNMAIRNTAIANGVKDAGEALMEVPGLAPLGGFLFVGGALGALYGWSTGE